MPKRQRNGAAGSLEGWHAKGAILCRVAALYFFTAAFSSRLLSSPLLQDGSMFKAQVDYHPYLYLHAKVGAALLVRVRSLKPRAHFDSNPEGCEEPPPSSAAPPTPGPACTLRSGAPGCCKATAVLLLYRILYRIMYRCRRTTWRWRWTPGFAGASRAL